MDARLVVVSAFRFLTVFGMTWLRKAVGKAVGMRWLRKVVGNDMAEEGDNEMTWLRRAVRNDIAEEGGSE